MNTILFLIIIIFLTACGKTTNGSSSNQALGLCAGPLAQGWINKTTDNVYDFKSDCTGVIQACEATFNYDPISQDSVYIEVLTSNDQAGCPLKGTKGYCDYHIKDTAGIVQSMWMKCDAVNTVDFVPLSGE